MRGRKCADSWHMSVASRPMVGYRTAARLSAAILLLAVGLVLTSSTPADAVGAEGEGWPAFNESDGCGSPWMRGPSIERTGWVPSSTPLRGPHADYFGRSIQQVWDSLFWWDVPMSNGESLRLHERMRPALEQVEAGLAQARANGKYYGIVDRYTYGYAARTVGGSNRISQHGLGNAIDINSVSNPYTTGKLKTNMPSWFVDVWSNSGFCWGGYWISVKDAMHYNWRGPLFTPGFTELPAAYPPSTSSESFTRSMHTDAVPVGLADTTHRLLMDGDGDGAVDVVNVSQTPIGTIVDVARARSGFHGCAVSRYAAPDLPTGDTAINGDWDRDGAQDIWIIDDSDGLKATAYLRFGDFSETDSATISAQPGDAYLSADYNVDGWGDLYILRHDAGVWSVEVRSGADRFASVLATGSVNGGIDTRFTAVDRNRDQVPDLFGIASGGSFIADGASSFSSVEGIMGVPGDLTDVAGTDFDGDGRHDLVTLEGGSLKVYAGNSRLAGLRVTSWFEFPSYSCSSTSLPYPYEGTFRDDDESVHRYQIDEIKSLGITRGCNPPLRDKFCPERDITRGELAAFLRRALDLPETTGDTYTDDNESIFEGDIESLVAAGVHVPCNAAGDRFCPDAAVTRDVMARFLTRAFGFEASSIDAFVDDNGSPYEPQINAIAAVRVTIGCNPPANDRFCPDRVVSRQEMASFMVRAVERSGS